MVLQPRHYSGDDRAEQLEARSEYSCRRFGGSRSVMPPGLRGQPAHCRVIKVDHDCEGWRHEEVRVTIDGPSGTYDDDPEQGADSKPEKEHEHGRRADAGNPADAQPAEVRTRAEYDEALRAMDQRMAVKAEIASSTTAARSAWDVDEAADHPDRPPLDSMRVTPERARHILAGDSWGGGHRHGTGRPTKTEFPSGWDDDKIVGHVLDVARAPDDPPVFQANHRWRVHGQREWSRTLRRQSSG